MSAAPNSGSKAKRPPRPRMARARGGVPPAPIRSEPEFARAVALCNRLIDLGSLTPEEEDFLVSLGDLIAAYEDEHEPMDEVPVSVMLRELIEAKGVTQRAVAAAAGVSDATVSAILSGQRLPSRKVMAALAAYFRVDPAAFL